jgi:hypothetical protein
MSEIDQKIPGMTVNERLAHFGLFEAFDAAVASRQLDSIVSVLRQARLSERQALESAQAILSNPAHYGFK